MAFQPTPMDIPVLITAASASDNAESNFVNERRVTPSWTVSQLKSKLETMTGVPPGFQSLKVKVPGRGDAWMEGDERRVEEWGLVKGAEIEVHDSRPKSMRPNYTDLSSVEKYELPTDTYESLPNSVLAWKRNQKLGRFDPNAPTPLESLQASVSRDRTEINNRGIELNKRVIILPSSPPHIRRGTVRFVGPVPTIPISGPGSALEKESEGGVPGHLQPIWVGVELDEPTGKNDGSVGGKRYFECGNKMGAFVKPDKVEVGDFPPLGLDEELEELMEEI